MLVLTHTHLRWSCKISSISAWPGAASSCLTRRMSFLEKRTIQDIQRNALISTWRQIAKPFSRRYCKENAFPRDVGVEMNDVVGEKAQTKVSKKADLVGTPMTSQEGISWVVSAVDARVIGNLLRNLEEMSSHKQLSINAYVPAQP